MANRAVLSVLLIFIAVGLATSTEHEHDVNVVADSILSDVKQVIRNENADPLRLSNSVEQPELSDCWLYGLSSLYRSGNCTLRRSQLHARIGFRQLIASCVIKTRILVFRYRAVVRMRMDDVTSTIVISQKDVGSNPSLDWLEVELEGFDLEAEGDSTLTFLIRNLKFVYMRSLQSVVRDNLKQLFRSSLTQYLSHVNSWSDIHPSLNSTAYL